jgi:hypothetical protein
LILLRFLTKRILAPDCDTGAFERRNDGGGAQNPDKIPNSFVRVNCRKRSRLKRRLLRASAGTSSVTSGICNEKSKAAT